MTEQQFEAIHAIAREHRSLSEIVRQCDYALDNLKNRVDDVVHVLGLRGFGYLEDELGIAELMQPLFVEAENLIQTVKARAIERMDSMEIPKAVPEVKP